MLVSYPYKGSIKFKFIFDKYRVDFFNPYSLILRIPFVGYLSYYIEPKIDKSIHRKKQMLLPYYINKKFAKQIYDNNMFLKINMYSPFDGKISAYLLIDSYENFLKTKYVEYHGYIPIIVVVASNKKIIHELFKTYKLLRYNITEFICLDKKHPVNMIGYNPNKNMYYDITSDMSDYYTSPDEIVKGLKNK
jgi:hypothetical protein